VTTAKRRLPAVSDNASRPSVSEIRHPLNFTPVVLTEGRISLRVMTEVSGLDQRLDRWCRWNDILRSRPPRGNDAGNTIGRLHGDGRPDQEQTKQAINGLPGLSQLPVLGTLFHSRATSTNRPGGSAR
jgi:pilus assembly protein CpaC